MDDNDQEIGPGYGKEEFGTLIGTAIQSTLANYALGHALTSRRLVKPFPKECTLDRMIDLCR